MNAQPNPPRPTKRCETPLVHQSAELHALPDFRALAIEDFLSRYEGRDA